MRDKNFMKYRYNVLQEVGFDFRPRNVDVVPWNAGFEELVRHCISLQYNFNPTLNNCLNRFLIRAYSKVAFGRLNGHYNVPCPIPENVDADHYNGDDEQISNAFRLYKWVRRIINEYPGYLSGKSSRLLNEDRVRQLTDIGFEFN